MPFNITVLLKGLIIFTTNHATLDITNLSTDANNYFKLS